METLTIRGIRLAFDRAGDGRELVLFLHGVGSDRGAWAEQAGFFAAQGYSTVAVDCRGHSDSDIARDISLEEFAQDSAELIQALGFERAHWVGLSMGGVIALQVWRSRPDTIASLVLANTFAHFPDSQALLDRMQFALHSRSLAEIARERIPLAFGNPPPPAVLDAAIAAMARKNPRAYWQSWVATWTPDFRADLPGITCPALVIAGGADRITPPALSEELAAGIPGARLVVLDGAGHLSNLDRPAAFNAAVLEFVRAQQTTPPPR